MPLNPAISCSHPRLWIAAAIAANTLVWGSVANAAEKVHWATGEALRQKLAEPVDVLWTEIPLRQAIESLSQAKKVAILIDRRVDPSRKLEVSLKEEPLESALKKIASPLGLGVSRLGAVIYLGPRPAAEHLPAVAATLTRDIRGLSTAMQRKYLQPKGFAWEDLATPRELLERLGRENDVKVANLEQMPHDLWAAADLPPSSLVDRLTLIAIQFDMTFQVSAGGKQLELVHLPETGESPSEGNQHGTTPLAKAKHPAAEPPTSVDKIRIDRISVKEKPLGPVLKQLAERLHLELRIDQEAIQAAGISLEQRVSMQVENATVDELFQALLKSTRLTFHRHQRVIEIVPEKNP
jgi:hypothetical protein